jgi:hypothetical protein
LGLAELELARPCYGLELGRMGIQEFVNKKLVRGGAVAAPGGAQEQATP